MSDEVMILTGALLIILACLGLIIWGVYDEV